MLPFDIFDSVIKYLKTDSIIRLSLTSKYYHSMPLSKVSIKFKKSTNINELVTDLFLPHDDKSIDEWNKCYHEFTKLKKIHMPSVIYSWYFSTISPIIEKKNINLPPNITHVYDYNITPHFNINKCTQIKYLSIYTQRHEDLIINLPCLETLIINFYYNLASPDIPTYIINGNITQTTINFDTHTVSKEFLVKLISSINKTKKLYINCLTKHNFDVEIDLRCINFDNNIEIASDNCFLII